MNLCAIDIEAVEALRSQPSSSNLVYKNKSGSRTAPLGTRAAVMKLHVFRLHGRIDPEDMTETRSECIS